jgi:hypothetical protein
MQTIIVKSECITLLKFFMGISTRRDSIRIWNRILLTRYASHSDPSENAFANRASRFVDGESLAILQYIYADHPLALTCGRDGSGLQAST